MKEHDIYLNGSLGEQVHWVIPVLDGAAPPDSDEWLELILGVSSGEFNGRAACSMTVGEGLAMCSILKKSIEEPPSAREFRPMEGGFSVSIKSSVRGNFRVRTTVHDQERQCMAAVEIEVDFSEFERFVIAMQSVFSFVTPET